MKLISTYQKGCISPRDEVKQYLQHTPWKVASVKIRARQKHFSESTLYSRGNANCAGCMQALKPDPAVQELYKKQFIDQENGPGGFYKKQ